MRTQLPVQRRTHAFPLAVETADDGGTAMRCGGSILSTPAGSIAGDVRALAVDRRRGTIVYEVRVVNETPFPIATFAYSADDATREELTWSSVVVPEFSSIAMPIELGFVRRARVPRLIVQLFAERAHLTLGGEPPPVETRNHYARSRALSLLCALGAAAAIAYVAERPRVVALGAPASVGAGQSFSVAYALGAATNAHYRFENASGNILSRGELDERTGSFTLTAPATASGGYDVVVQAQSPLGDSQRVAHLVALAPPASAQPAMPARVHSLSLSSDDVDAGDALEVDYRADANAGTVEMLDENGTIRAQALYSHRGSSLLIAPQVERDQDMRVVLDVARGTATAEASAAVRVHATHPRAIDVATPADPAASAAGVADGPLRFPKSLYRSGETIELGVRYDEPALHVTLNDAAGAPFFSRDVAPGATNISFAAPRVENEEHLSIVATYARGFGVETIVHPLTISPERDTPNS